MTLWSALNYHLRNELIYDRDYSLDELYAYYHQIMNRDAFCELGTVKKDAFRKHVAAWASVHDGWLVKKGEGKTARYYKRYPDRFDIKLKIKEVMGRLWKR